MLKSQNDKLRELYNDYINSDAYPNTPEIQADMKRGPVFGEYDSMLRKLLGKKDYVAIADLACARECQDAETHFILGFKYAVGMLELLQLATPKMYALADMDNAEVKAS